MENRYGEPNSAVPLEFRTLEVVEDLTRRSVEQATAGRGDDPSLVARGLLDVARILQVLEDGSDDVSAGIGAVAGPDAVPVRSPLGVAVLGGEPLDADGAVLRDFPEEACRPDVPEVVLFGWQFLVGAGLGDRRPARFLDLLPKVIGEGLEEGLRRDVVHRNHGVEFPWTPVKPIVSAFCGPTDWLAMDERAALRMIAETLPAAGDDAAIVDGRVLTIDMLHETTDFPAGTTRYTAGWRTVGASLSDVAAMGARAVAAVAVYAAPSFDPSALESFLAGARDVCETVDAEYVGGDLDHHAEFTVATTALGETDAPVTRDGASPGEVVCVTGTLGRTGAALRRFDRGDTDRGNTLFQFEPRVAAGLAVGPTATAMMDSSDGLARSLHQLAEASGCGFAVNGDSLPIDEAVRAVATDPTDARELAIHVGEDFELVFTVPAPSLEAVIDVAPVPVTAVGEVTAAADGVTIDGEPLPDRGYTHEG